MNADAKKKTIFITGATGFLGGALLKQFSAEKFDVRVLIRNPKAFHSEFHNVSVIEGDITKSETLKGQLADIDTVIHAAGVVTDWASKSLYRDVHVGGTKNLIEEAVKSGVKKIVFISSLSVLDYSAPGMHSEHSPLTKIKNGYAGTKKEAEEMILSYHKRGLIEAVIIRPGWIYGKNDTTFIPEIVYQTKRNKMVIVGNSRNRVPFVHVDNLAELIRIACEKEIKDANIFNIADGNISWKDLTEKISKSVQSNRPIPSIPYLIAISLAHILESFARFSGSKKRPLLTVSSVQMIGRDMASESITAREVLRYFPRISFEEGLNSVIMQIAKRRLNELKMK
ncbi:MAG: NAD-dependent epimerase/dehydratase family protein [Candidatus Paceibacterota bacterium]|jgi:nucleoside-diphosphate-sugar epimerase